MKNSVKIGLGLALLLLVWIGNIFYFQLHQLEKPLFMKHFYSLQNVGNVLELDLYYLVNHQEDVDIHSVHIPELGQDVYPTWSDEHQTLKYHKVKSTRLEWNAESLATLDPQTRITEIEVVFTDGARQVVDIGEIVLNVVQSDHPFLVAQSTGGSSDHSGFSFFREEQALKLVGVKHLPPNLEAKNMTLQVNGEDIKGEIHPEMFDFKPYLEVKYTFHFSKEDPRAQHVYRSFTTLEVQTEDGGLKEGLLSLHYIPYWGDKDIKMILKERKGN